MVFGYVLVSTKNSYERDVADKLSMFEEVVDIEPLLIEETAMADPFFEEYNLIAKIKTSSSREIQEFVDDNIHTIAGIKKIKIVSRSK